MLPHDPGSRAVGWLVGASAMAQPMTGPPAVHDGKLSVRRRPAAASKRPASGFGIAYQLKASHAPVGAPVLENFNVDQGTARVQIVQG